MKKSFKSLAIIMSGILLIGAGKKEQHIIWELDNLEAIGGHKVTVEGKPKVIDTPYGKALEFDGVDDGIFLDVHPADRHDGVYGRSHLSTLCGRPVRAAILPYAGRRNNRTRNV